MRVNSVGFKYSSTKNVHLKSRVNHKGKHQCAKTFATIAGSLGTLGALGGIAIMTGGISIIPTIAYGALCGGIGAIGGHIIDKAQPDNKKNKK